MTRRPRSPSGARDLSKEPPLKLQLELPKLSALALGLLKAALDSFVQRIPPLRATIPRDKEVNALHKSRFRRSSSSTKQSPTTSSAACICSSPPRASNGSLITPPTSRRKWFICAKRWDIRHADKI